MHRVTDSGNAKRPAWGASKRLLLGLALVFLSACEKQSAPPVTPEANESNALQSPDAFQIGMEELGPRELMPGAPLYETHCASCHAGTVTRAPAFAWLEMMTPQAVLATMTEGVMRQQANHLSVHQKRAVAEFITRTSLDSQVADAPAPTCTGEAAEFDLRRPIARVGWGHDTSRFVGETDAGFTAEALPRLELKWAFAYPNARRARSQPAIAFGAVYVGSQDGRVYAFDLETGCQRWSFQAAAEVRTGIVVGEPPPSAPEDPPTLYFGDILAKLYAVHALTGELVWSLKVDPHPSATLTGTPALAGNRLLVPISSLEVIPASNLDYACCTFQGRLVALEPATGMVLWSHSAIPNPPQVVGRTIAGQPVLAPSGAPIWSSPTVDLQRNLVYFGTGQNYSSPADRNGDAIIAVDLDTGERVWQRQSTAGDAWNVACMMEDNPNCPEEDGPDFDHGSSIILAQQEESSSVLLAGHKNGTIFGLDPDRQGALLWATRVGRGSIQGGVHFGMATGEGLVYAPINDMNNTRNGDLLDPDLARPGMHALDVASGEVMWRHIQENLCGAERPFCDPGISAAVTALPGGVIAGHLDGVIRAYSAQTGEVVWSYDTTQPVAAVNGMMARGGGMSGGGPAIGDGHLVVNSGYGLYFHEPGNALMVFAPKAPSAEIAAPQLLGLEEPADGAPAAAPEPAQDT